MLYFSVLKFPESMKETDNILIKFLSVFAKTILYYFICIIFFFLHCRQFDNCSVAHFWKQEVGICPIKIMLYSINKGKKKCSSRFLFYVYCRDYYFKSFFFKCKFEINSIQAKHSLRMKFQLFIILLYIHSNKHLIHLQVLVRIISFCSMVDFSSINSVLIAEGIKYGRWLDQITKQPSWY